MLNVSNVSRETYQQLEIFVDLVLRWNPAINLISKSTQIDIWDRHIADSAQLAEHLPRRSLTCLDVGSGGGFPGIILAILRPDSEFVLVEADQRKATFLREVIRILGLSATVSADRIERLQAQNSDILTARAFAPLTKLLGCVQPHVKSEGTCLFLKGGRYEAEIDEARRLFTFDCDLIPSQTDPSGMILKICGIQNA